MATALFFFEENAMDPRTPLIAGNWKMFKTVPEAVDSARSLVALTADVTDVQVMIAPPFPALVPVAEATRGSRVALGAQNLYWEKEGAFTGEVSAPMLAAAGCRFVLVGHSERRQYFGETDETVNRKIGAAIDAGLIPVFCIGETEPQRENKETFKVLDKQVQNGLKGLDSYGIGSLVIAYEPIWAIGTGKTATTEQAQQVHVFLRGIIEKRFGNLLAKSIRILYGGSVKPTNIRDLMAQPDIDGALVGGASLSAESFSQIVHYK
jgi:triosephosphate isomerase